MKKILLPFLVFLSSVLVTCSKTPKILWNYEIGGNNVPTTLIALDKHNNIYFGTSKDKIYSLSPSGETRWIYKTDASPCGLAVDDADNIYVTTEGFSLISLTSGGKLRWSQQTGENAVLAIGYDGTIITGNNQGLLIAFNNNGDELWVKETGGAIRSAPAVDRDGNIYFGTGDVIFAVDSKGEIKWSIPTKDEIWTTPAFDEKGTMYIGSRDKKIYFINMDEGLIGAQSNEYIDPSSVTIDKEGTLYFTSYETGSMFLYAVRPAGKVMWKHEIENMAFAPPTLGNDGSIYLVAGQLKPDRGYLYKFSPDGKVVWKKNIGCIGLDHFSPVISKDGTLYLLSLKRTKMYGDIGIVYAIQTGSMGLADSPWPKFGADNQNTGRVNAP